MRAPSESAKPSLLLKKAIAGSVPACAAHRLAGGAGLLGIAYTVNAARALDRHLRRDDGLPLLPNLGRAAGDLISPMPIIAIVDDDPGTLRLDVSTLAAAGHIVLCHESSDTFRMVICRFRPGVFILDLQIPHVDGLDICRWVRGIPEYPRTPVLFLTSRSEAVTEALAAGGNDYLARPIHPKPPIERLERQIRRRAA
jgi:CheY-like chemotaxis protein